MSKKILSFLFISLVILTSIFLLGCKQEKIKFYRESQASTLLEKLQGEQDKTTVKKSSGFIIYKDERYNNKNQTFGPKDLDFNLPRK